MKNIDSKSHVRGESVYIDDIPLPATTLHGAIFYSSIAKGKIKELKLEKALLSEGVVRIFTVADVVGSNLIGGVIRDRELFADKKINYAGQPVAFVVAQTRKQALQGRELIELVVEEEKPVLDPIEAYKKNLLIVPSRTFLSGDPDQAFKKCDYLFEGSTSTGAQEHLYLECQAVACCNEENGCFKIYAGSQGSAAVQTTVALVLAIPMHKIEVEIGRLGGAFGGKEEQNSSLAAFCALACSLLKRPVKLILSRRDDLIITGKRHPYEGKYKIGLDKQLKIVAYETTLYQNGGADCDLSPAIMERSLFHANGSYFIKNFRATCHSCKTNITPNTAFRGFGAPQGAFVIEAAIDHAARELGVAAHLIQQLNLLKKGDVMPYGQKIKDDHGRLSYLAAEKYLTEIKEEVELFNGKNERYKKGYAVQPICFGISFTKKMLNQARALIHIYTDGSVSVSTGAVEMGQGVNTKLLAITAAEFGICPDRIKIEKTNTTRVANASPTAASTGCDLNGQAIIKAVRKIKKRLLRRAAEILKKDFAKLEIKDEFIYLGRERTELNWESLIQNAYAARISLSDVGHYATARIGFDEAINKGNPFAYHVFGTAVTEVTVDILLGTYNIDKVKIVHDAGKSIDPELDRGQICGALVQGIGWLTLEELLHSEKGVLLTNNLAGYKIPDIYFAPDEIEIDFLEEAESAAGVLRSKAVGEPPFLYGIGAYFAIRNAVSAFKKDITIPYQAPLTPEKILLALYGK